MGGGDATSGMVLGERLILTRIMLKGARVDGLEIGLLKIWRKTT